MKEDIFTKVIETVRGNPAEYDITVQNITGKILSQNNLKPAEILERFVDEWNHSESSKDSIVIAWLLSDRFLGTGEPAVRKVFADRLLERIDPEDNHLNPERLQELIHGVIFSDEESIETLRNALIASKQIPKTTSSGGKAGNKSEETGKNADKIIGDKFNLWGLEIHWRVFWDKLKKQMTNLKTCLRRDK